MCNYELLGSNSQYIRYRFSDFLKLQALNKVKKIDLTIQSPHIYVDSEEYQDLTELKNMLKKAEITVYSITPAPYRYSICADLNSIQHQKTIEYYKNCILVAKELGASYVCITGSGACYDKNFDLLRDNAKHSLKELAEFASKNMIVLLLGTVLGEESEGNASTPVLVKLNEIKNLIDSVQSKSLKAYMDTEVISLCGETITQWFNSLDQDIKLIRFTDGNYNGYRIWGNGCLPCRKYIEEIVNAGYNGKLSLQIPGEKYIDNPEDFDRANIQYLQEILGQVK